MGESKSRAPVKERGQRNEIGQPLNDDYALLPLNAPRDKKSESDGKAKDDRAPASPAGELRL
jgi:hypothetical protein